MNFLKQVLPGLPILFGALFGFALPADAQAAAPISLSEAIAKAQHHHPLIEAAVASENAARGATREARAALYPSISVAEDALFSNDPVFAFGSKLRQARFSSADFAIDALNHPSPLSNFSASATATWTAFDAGSSRHRIGGANASLQAARLETRYTAEQLAAQVATLYYRVLTAEDQVGVAERAVHRAREVDESVQDRVRSGFSLESDGARAHLGLRNAQDDLLSAKSNVTLARHDLFAAIGDSPSDRPLVRPDIPQTSFGANSETSGDLDQRFDIQALRMKEQAARQNLAAIKAGAWPQVTTFGHVENDAEYVVTNGSGNWTIGAKVQFSVFDGGARRAHQQQTVAQLHSLEAQERSTLLEADATVAALKNEIDDLHRRLATAEEASRVQENALKTSRDRYTSGLVTITDVLDGENDLAGAEFLRVRTYYQLCIANANLALATGTVVDSKAGQP